MSYSAGNAPDLDRFSRPGPNERRWGVKVLTMLPDCHVCGQEVHPAFLVPWNGQEVCKYCRRELEDEFERECGEYSEDKPHGLSDSELELNYNYEERYT